MLSRRAFIGSAAGAECVATIARAAEAETLDAIMRRRGLRPGTAAPFCTHPPM